MARTDRVMHPRDPIAPVDSAPCDAPEDMDAVQVPAPRAVFPAPALCRRGLDALGVDYVTSLPCTTSADRIALANVLNIGGDMLRAQANLVLSVRHVTVVPVDYTSPESGEVTEGLRVILTTEDGHHYSCGGVTPVRAIRRIVSVFGPLPFQPAVKVRVKPIPLADGKSTYTLEVVA